MDNTLGGVLRTAVHVFKKTFWQILGIYLGVYAVTFIVGLIASLLFGKNLATIRQMNPDMVPGMLGSMLPKIILFFLLLFVVALLMFLVGISIVLIVRNNILVGKSFIKEAFFESFRKIWKILGFGVILGVAVIFISIVLAMLLGKSFLLILIPLFIFLGPLLFTANYNLLCKEGDFIELISDGISLGTHNWLIIFGYMALVVISVIAITIVMLLVFIPLQMIGNLTILVKIISYAWQSVLSLFITCFYTVFYLDLAGIKPQTENLIETNQNQIMP